MLARALLVVLLACAPPLSASAQTHMDKALFLELATSPDDEAWGLLLVHLKGVLAGLEAANMQLVRRGDAPLFCPPPDAVLTPEWAAEELKAYLARYSMIPANTSIAVIATFALADAFACETPAALR
jgi:hypothetical protein